MDVTEIYLAIILLFIFLQSSTLKAFWVVLEGLTWWIPHFFLPLSISSLFCILYTCEMLGPLISLMVNPLAMDYVKNKV